MRGSASPMGHALAPIMPGIIEMKTRKVETRAAAETNQSVPYVCHED
jgi:hypothetical protein